MFKLKPFAAVLAAQLVVSAPLTFAATAEDNYQQFCASCHGKELQGGLGSSLVDEQWRFGASDEAITKVIREGLADAGMPPWGNTLSDKDIRALVIFIREQAAQAKVSQAMSKVKPQDGVYSSQHHDFKLEQVAEGFDVLWALEFLPDGSLLVTERKGNLWLIDGKGRKAVSGIPKVWAKGQGGLLDVAVKPSEKAGETPWVYLSYSQPNKKGAMTAIARGKIENGRFTQAQIIYQADDKFYTDRAYHFGSRMVFDGDYLFFSVGDRGVQDQAQDLTQPNGKIHRIFADGRIPKDNPFVGVKGALATIWSYGSRNAQGLTLATDGKLWETEHGPRGGDEVNLIEKGVNYGWPKITYGMNYDGTPITPNTQAPDMAQPKHYWVPSIAVTSIAEYVGSAFPKWQNHLLVGSLAKQEVQRLTLKDGEIVASELLLKNEGRIRDLVVGPDGYVYLAMVKGTDKKGAIYRLVPTKDK